MTWIAVSESAAVVESAGKFIMSGGLTAGLLYFFWLWLKGRIYNDKQVADMRSLIKESCHREIDSIRRECAAEARQKDFWIVETAKERENVAKEKETVMRLLMTAERLSETQREIIDVKKEVQATIKRVETQK